MPKILITRSRATLSRGSNQMRAARKFVLQDGAKILILFVLVAIVSMLFLVHSNQSATKGYSVRILDNEHEGLVQKNEFWNMRIAEAKAMARILDSRIVRNMVEAKEVQYIEVVPGLTQ